MPTISGTATANKTIQLAPTPGSYPTGATVSTHWRIVGWHLSVVAATVADVEINSYNVGTTTVTKTLIETGACGVAGGSDGQPNEPGANYGDAAPGDAIQIASSSWGGSTVAYLIELTQVG